jgi:c-di-GMP-binding flagellar brake protein YcgR
MTTSANLGIELGTLLQLHFEGLKESQKGALVGMERDAYLIVRVPSVAGVWARLHQENGVIVRYVYEGTVYGFQCTLVGVMDKPVHLVLLSYPGRIESVQLRKEDRVACLIPASARIQTREFKAVILDVSFKGCAIALQSSAGDRLLPQVGVGDEIVISAQFSGSTGEKAIRTVVKNVRKDDKKAVIGNQFQELDADAEKAIQDYLKNVEEFKDIAKKR